MPRAAYRFLRTAQRRSPTRLRVTVGQRQHDRVAGRFRDWVVAAGVGLSLVVMALAITVGVRTGHGLMWSAAVGLLVCGVGSFSSWTQPAEHVDADGSFAWGAGQGYRQRVATGSLDGTHDPPACRS